MSEEILAKFHTVNKDPGQYAAEWTYKTKRKALGVFPNYFPVELIDAAGMLPVGLWGSPVSYDKADAHLQPFICSLIKTNFAMALEGRMGALSGAVFPEICDSLQNSEGIWHALFPDHFTTRFRISRNPTSPSAKVFLLSEIRRIAKELEEIAGVSITDLELVESILRRNALRQRVRTLLEKFYKSQMGVNAADFYAMIKASHIMDVDEWMELTNTFVMAPPQLAFGGTTVFLSGMTCEPWWILDVLERVDVTVVGDDLAFATRYYGKNMESGGDPFEAVANYSLDLNPCANLHFNHKDRGDYFVQQVKKAGAQGVVFTRLKFCDPESFDHPYLKALLEQADIPSLIVETDINALDVGAITTRIEAFVETLEAGDAQ